MHNRLIFSCRVGGVRKWRAACCAHRGSLGVYGPLHDMDRMECEHIRDGCKGDTPGPAWSPLKDRSLLGARLATAREKRCARRRAGRPGCRSVRLRNTSPKTPAAELRTRRPHRSARHHAHEAAKASRHNDAMQERRGASRRCAGSTGGGGQGTGAREDGRLDAKTRPARQGLERKRRRDKRRSQLARKSANRVRTRGPRVTAPASPPQLCAALATARSLPQAPVRTTPPTCEWTRHNDRRCAHEMDATALPPDRARNATRLHIGLLGKRANPDPPTNANRDVSDGFAGTRRAWPTAPHKSPKPPRSALFCESPQVMKGGGRKTKEVNRARACNRNDRRPQRPEQRTPPASRQQGQRNRRSRSAHCRGGVLMDELPQTSEALDA